MQCLRQAQIRAPVEQGGEQHGEMRALGRTQTLAQATQGLRDPGGHGRAFTTQLVRDLSLGHPDEEAQGHGGTQHQRQILDRVPKRTEDLLLFDAVSGAGIGDVGVHGVLHRSVGATLAPFGNAQCLATDDLEQPAAGAGSIVESCGRPADDDEGILDRVGRIRMVAGDGQPSANTAPP